MDRATLATGLGQTITRVAAEVTKSPHEAKAIELALRRIFAGAAILLDGSRACSGCGQLWRWQQPLPLPVEHHYPGCCSFCGARIAGKEQNQRYCSNRCRKDAWAARQEARNKSQWQWKEERPAWQGKDTALCWSCVGRMMRWAQLREMPEDRQERLALLVWAGYSVMGGGGS